jgi:hypothetical protein
MHKWPRLRRTVHAGVCVAAFAAFAGVAHAQRVRGTVTSQGMPLGIAGAVVLLVDTANVPRARALTGAHGEFTLTAPTLSRYSIRALRIGFQPWSSPLFAVRGDTALAIALEDLPLALPAVTSREQNQCRSRPDSGLALAVLWNDVKTALLATQITGEASVYQFDLVDHSRVYDYDTRALRSVQLADVRIRSARSWVSVSPDQLRREGYVVRRADSTTFIAPDIETLLSDYFVDTHCFRIAESRQADSMLVIRFDPAEDYHHAEVAGALRVNRRSHELRGLEFYYVDLPLAAADSIAGGDVEFARLPTGGWVMTDWSIRIPSFGVETESAGSLIATPARSRGAASVAPVAHPQRRLVPTELRVSGGTLRRVSMDDVAVWSSGEHAVQVRIAGADSARASSADQVTVYLMGAPRYGFVDSTGSATIDHLVPGSYLVDVGSRELDLLGWPRTRVRLEVDATPVVRTIVRLEDPLRAARETCPTDASRLSESTGVLIGAVTRGSQPVGRQDVTLSWSNSSGQTESRTVRTLGGDGRFIVCGVPRGQPIAVETKGVAPMSAQLTRDQVVGTIVLSLQP